MILYISLMILVAQTGANPLPQDPNDDAEVFSGPVSSSDYDYYGSFFPRPRVRILVVPVSRDEADEEYPDYTDSRPSLFSILRSFLGSRVPQTTTSSEDDDNCFLCSIFEDSFKSFRNHVDNVKDRENEIEFDYVSDEEGLDVNNSTHTTKVLDDGTVVHINKTTIADTDENGNSFFFHRAVIHHDFADSDDGADDTAQEEEDNTEDVIENEESDEVVEEEEDGVDAGLLDI